MDRKVQSNATMFGMVELNPKKMCEYLARLEGTQALQKYPYCLDDTPYEQ